MKIKKILKNYEKYKEKIMRGKLLFALIAIIIVIITIFSIYSYMDNKIVPIQYDNNISIKELNGNIYAVLKNNSYVNAKSKIVEITNDDGETEKYLYFYFSTTYGRVILNLYQTIILNMSLFLVIREK